MDKFWSKQGRRAQLRQGFEWVEHFHVVGAFEGGRFFSQLLAPAAFHVLDG